MELRTGIDVNAVTSQGKTPLIFAAISAQRNMTQFLIEAGI